MASGKKTQLNKNQSGDNSLKDEITLWIILAFCCLLVISNMGFGGKVGDALSFAMSGLFGVVSHAFPFVFFGLTAFLISNKRMKTAYYKSFFFVLLYIQICVVFGLLNQSGGILGKFLSELMRSLVGTAGTYMGIIFISIISLVCITGKTLFRNRIRIDRPEEIKKNVANQNHCDSDDGCHQDVRRRKHAKGVTLNTKITCKSPEIKELSAPHSLKKPAQAESNLSSVIIHRGESPDSVPRKSTPSLGKVKSCAKEKTYKTGTSYQLPAVSLLRKGEKTAGDSDEVLRKTALKLQATLQNFGVNVHVSNISYGPTVTRYELQPEMGVKVSKIVGLSDDIKLNLAVSDIRIEAPIPGKAAVGIEVPNKDICPVMLRDIFESQEFKNSHSKTAFAVGKDIAGKPVVFDIAKMPHLLIAGATGSGKSVCINTLILSLLFKSAPEDVRLIMIDPKVVELSIYNGIPHLLIPVVTDPKKAAGALNWAVAEMTNRYNSFAKMGVRDIRGYNNKVEMASPCDNMEVDKSLDIMQKMPQIVIIVDELADLMMVAPGDVEASICRLAQLARAAGIHLVIATQRPSVNVITGLIKANMPSRIAFSVSSGVDSRTIIDMNGAEKLLGKGDMLFYPVGHQKPERVQGAFVSDKEVQDVVDDIITKNGDAFYDEKVEEHMVMSENEQLSMDNNAADDARDFYFADAGRLIIEKDKASIGMLQRTFKIGFNRAARIMDQLCEAKVVGGEEGTKPRKILMDSMTFEKIVNDYTPGGKQ